MGKKWEENIKNKRTALMGYNLRVLRLNSGYSVRMAAALLGGGSNTIYQYERGELAIPTDKMLVLLRAYSKQLGAPVSIQAVMTEKLVHSPELERRNRKALRAQESERRKKIIEDALAEYEEELAELDLMPPESAYYHSGENED